MGRVANRELNCMSKGDRMKLFLHLIGMMQSP